MLNSRYKKLTNILSRTDLLCLVITNQVRLNADCFDASPGHISALSSDLNSDIRTQTLDGISEFGNFILSHLRNESSKMILAILNYKSQLTFAKITIACSTVFYLLHSNHTRDLYLESIGTTCAKIEISLACKNYTVYQEFYQNALAKFRS